MLEGWLSWQCIYVFLEWRCCLNLWCRLLGLHKRYVNVEALLVLEGRFSWQCIDILLEWRCCLNLRYCLLGLHSWYFNVEAKLVLVLAELSWLSWQSWELLSVYF